LPSTSLTDPKKSYGIHVWGEGNFIVEDGVVKVNYGNKPSLIELTKGMREKGYKGPLLFRFPHLAAQNVRTLFKHFERAKKRV